MSGHLAVAVRNMRVMSLVNEMATTRKVIAAIPEAAKGWRPDPKARTAFEVAWHIVSSEVQMLEATAVLKFTTEARYKDVPATVEALVAWYDAHFPQAIERVKAMTAEQLNTEVDLFGAFMLPSHVFLGMVESHTVHHRGQLSVYLRPMGGKVPSIYGGSADEPWKMERPQEAGDRGPEPGDDSGQSLLIPVLDPS
jgi:uncharacterized damage-inducible protein DinB